MSFLENTTFKKTLMFVKQSDTEEKFQLTITLNTNHDLKNSVLNEIERLVDSLFLSNYMKEEQYRQHLKLEKEQLKLEKEQEKMIKEELKEKKPKEKPKEKKQTGVRLLSEM